MTRSYEVSRSVTPMVGSSACRRIVDAARRYADAAQTGCKTIRGCMLNEAIPLSKGAIVS